MSTGPPDGNWEAPHPQYPGYNYRQVGQAILQAQQPRTTQTTAGRGCALGGIALAVVVIGLLTYLLGGAWQTTPKTALPASYVGTWTGNYNQSPDLSYPMILTLRSGGANGQVGEVTYPSLECRGVVRLQQADARGIALLERQVSGRCLNTSYTLQPDGQLVSAGGRVLANLRRSP